MSIDWDAAVLGPCEDVFGEPATFLPAVGGNFAITGVFDSAYRDVSLIDVGLETNAVQPVLGVRSALFQTQPMQGDQVFIPSAGTTYFVRDVRPDGHGWIKLMLSDAAEIVTYQPRTGSAYTTSGVFNSDFISGVMPPAGTPSIAIATSRLKATPVVGDQIQVPRTLHTYYVTSFGVIANGVTLLQLSP